MSTGAGLAIAVFLAAAVEFVEAFTIVLAIGLSRGWRAAIAGSVAALVVLATATAAVGPVLARWVPETLLQLIVGVLLLMFGAQWLRKAVLRAAGLKAKHDEDATFRAERVAAEAAVSGRRWGVDGFGFIVAFKGVLLEGLEVVVIVVLLGASAGQLGLATAAAGVALVAVLGLGLITYRPLSRIPENTLAFGVGLLLITFGTFWAVEGLGVFAPSGTLSWPGGDLALVAVLVGWTVGALLAVQIAARLSAGAPARRAPEALSGLARFIWEFLVGDDWRIAVAIMVVLVVGAFTATTSAVPVVALAPVLAIALVVVTVTTLLVGALPNRRG